MTRRKKLAICNAVITHWMCNLMLAYAGEMKKIDGMSADCAFCKAFPGCLFCPLDIYGHHRAFLSCVDEWRDTANRKPKSCAAMLTELGRVCDLWLAEEAV
jgi:hypothetical protein